MICIKSSSNEFDNCSVGQLHVRYVNFGIDIPYKPTRTPVFENQILINDFQIVNLF